MVQIEWRVFIKEHGMVLLRSQLMNFSYNFDTQQYTFKKGYLAKSLTTRGLMPMPSNPKETQEIVKKMKKLDKNHKSKSLTAYWWHRTFIREQKGSTRPTERRARHATTTAAARCCG